MKLPTPEEINALPEHIRAYIHELEVNADPSGDRRELITLREQNVQLQRHIEEQQTKDDINRLTAPRGHYDFKAHRHGDRWMPMGLNQDGDEVWCDGCCISDKTLAERIALNMQAAYNKGIEHAVRSQIQHGIRLLEGGSYGSRKDSAPRGAISNTMTSGGWVVGKE